MSTFLDYYNHIVNHIQKEYEKAFLPKKDGTYRSLYIPSMRLRFCLDPIKDRILSQLPVSKFATAYQKGSSTRKNAEPHIGKKNLLKLDITDFFGSISFEQVLCFQHPLCIEAGRLSAVFSVLQKWCSSTRLTNISCALQYRHASFWWPDRSLV